MRASNFSRQLQVTKRFLRELPTRIHRLALLNRHRELSLGARLSLLQGTLFSAKLSPLRSKRYLRTLACLAIILNLVIWPSPGVTVRPVIDPMSFLASIITSTASSVSSAHCFVDYRSSDRAGCVHRGRPSGSAYARVVSIKHSGLVFAAARRQWGRKRRLFRFSLL